MRIDWFTFVAQIFNFLLLVYLLKRFLYRPVLGAIDRREEGIRRQLDEALAHERATAEERRSLEAGRAEFETRRSTMIRELEEEVEALRRERKRELQDRLRRVHAEWRSSLRQQEQGFLDELSRRITRESFAIAKRLLTDLADSGLEEQAVRIFLSRLPKSDPETRAGFAEAVGRTGGRVRVKTAFPLSPAHREEITRVLREWTGARIEVEFQEDPSLALGIELRAGDRKVAWSVESYLDSLRADALAHLASEAG